MLPNTTKPTAAQLAAAEEYRKWDAARWAANPRPWEREEGYGRLKCSLCGGWADSQVCKRCSATLERTGGRL